MPTEFQFASLNGQWPRARTLSEDRKANPFKMVYNRTLDLLRYEIDKLNPRGPAIIQADFKAHEIRLDGMIRADARMPEFPGVILNVTSNNRGALRFLCDDCRAWEHNVHAIALTLERLRLCDLYGVTKDGEQYKGWKALPAPEHSAVASIDVAAAFLAKIAEDKYPGIPNADIAAEILRVRETAKFCYRHAASKLHPDAGGDAEQWKMLQAAWGLISQIAAK